MQVNSHAIGLAAGGRTLVLPPLPDAVLDAYLAEDVPLLDLTTHVLGIGAARGRMSFRARDGMVVACAEEAARLVERSGATAALHKISGETLQAGEAILTATGPAAALLRSWKIAQNLVEVASGIASVTRDIVSAARAVAPEVAVACTRKNAPGTKLMSVKAILSGGAVPHRLGLAETILIFPEHRAFLAGMPEKAIVAAARRDAAEKKIVVEVGGLAEAIAFAEAGADVVQAEKFTPDLVAELRREVGRLVPRPLIAAAGGINAGNAAAYAAAGADILVTSAPYWAKPRDVAVRIEAM
jgi:molybdenum transport protein